MKNILLLLSITLLLFSSCQKENPTLFSAKIKKLQPEVTPENYSELSRQIINTKMDNFIFDDSDGNKIELTKIKSPVIIYATASWCKACKAMRPALNELVEKYGTEIKFIALSHDYAERAEKYREELHPNITLIPSKSKKNPNGNDKLDVGDFKHIFPFTTFYYLDKNKVIQDISIGANAPTSTEETEIEKVKNINIALIEKGIQQIL